MARPTASSSRSGRVRAKLERSWQERRMAKRRQQSDLGPERSQSENQRLKDSLMVLETR
jgi:hypothetical protein